MAASRPEAFEQVSLKDRSTWHRATLREWIDARALLLEKQGRQGDPWEWAMRMNRAQMEVSSRLNKEMEILDGKPHPPQGGDIGKRREALLQELFYDKYPDYDPLSEWEKEYIEVSAWVERVVEAYHQQFRESDVGLLFAWILTLEDEEGLAGRRHRVRERNRAAVARTSAQRLKAKKNPFYPQPLELVRIAAAAEIVVDNYRRDYSHFLTYGDPVPGTESVEDFRIRAFLRNDTAQKAVARLIDALRQHGYLLCRDEEDCRSWPGWRESFRQSSRVASRSLLAYIFDVDTATIRKSLSRGVLSREYERCGVTDELRIYVEKSRVPDVATVLRAGWASRVVDGFPNRYDSGITYFRKPPLFESSDK